MNLTELINAYVEDRCAGKVNETRISYRGKLRRLELHFSPTADPASFTPDMVHAWRLELLTCPMHLKGRNNKVPGPLSQWTVITVLKTAKQFFRWAHKRGYLAVDLGEHIEIPKPPKMAPKAIDAEDVHRLIEKSCEITDVWSMRDRAIIYMLRDTGARVGAIAKLKVIDVNLEACEVRAVEKGGVECTLYFGQATRQAVSAWMCVRAYMPTASDQLWLTSKYEGARRQTLMQILKRACARAGVSGRHNAHAFRHAFARETLRAGADLSTVSQLLGHSRVDITAQYYARWDDKELKNAHARFSPGRNLKVQVHHE